MTVHSNKALFALWVVAVITAVIALMILFGGFAGAAEMSYCKTYANRMSAMALQRLVACHSWMSPREDFSTAKLTVVAF